MARDEDLAGATTASDSGTWFADHSARFAKTAEDTARAGAAADRWARRSLADGEWTVVTTTADIIADWEEMTALMGPTVAGPVVGSAPAANRGSETA